MNWKSILTLAAIGLVINVSAQELTLEDIWKKGTFRQRSVYGLRSMQDGVHYTAMDRDSTGTSIKKYAYETGKAVSTVLTESEFQSMTSDKNLRIEGYQFSEDEQQMLIATEQENIYRRSTKENYYLVDLKTRKASLIYYDGKQRHASFSPDGSMVAFVVDNNVTIFNPSKHTTTVINKDGAENSVINGYADWVYEEEFAFSKAFFWSPDGKKIAYYKFNEGAVKEFNMQKFTELYPEDYRYKYPKAGEKNSIVSIHVYDIETQETHNLNLGEYEYIPRIKWTETGEFLAVMKMPRLQNQLEIVLVETNNYTTSTIYKESSDTYIEISDDLTFFGNNAGFIWKSEKNGYFHLYRYKFNGEGEQQITSGKWDVHDFMGYDAESKRVFYTASPNDPMNLGLYSASVDGGKTKTLSPEEGNSRASFSQNFKYYILYHSTANSPQRVTLHQGDGTEIRVLEDNADLVETMGKLKLSTVEFFDVKASETKLNGWMMKPADFDSKKKYPVLMYVYGGPGSQTVTNAISGNYWWHQLMVSKGYIVVSVDNRGTGSRGRDFRTQTYRQLGNLETQDQIEAAKWLAGQSYVDGSRIGIWGWSYGGYMSSLCLFKGADVFKTAIAVAPVTNWRYYDSIYTERYMGLPQDNGNGYDDNSPISHVEKLEGNYLLVHGTGDDNVHYQNSVEIVDALIDADKQFDYMIYPERNHGIYGGNTRYHLFTKITDFISDNL